MAKKYIIYEADNLCCNPGQFHYVKSWTYTPKEAGKNIYYIENTYYQGNALKYLWMEIDEEELDDCGKPKGDLVILFQCLDPCVIEQWVSPITLIQTGGFAMPTSTTNYRALQLTNCIGPTVLGPQQVTGLDVPFGVKITIQAFGGFGMTRTFNSSNRNLTGFTRQIRNRRQTEVANPTDGYYVPWLKDETPGQIAAGKKMIYERKFGEGNHTFEFAANMPGPSYFSVMDEASCIRYWPINVVASHCYDWTKNAPISGPDLNNPAMTLAEVSDAGGRKSYLSTKSNLIPIDKDKALIEKFHIQTDSRANAWCSCDANDPDQTARGNSASPLNSYSSTRKNTNTELYPAGTEYIQGARIFSAADKNKNINQYVKFNVPRHITSSQGGTRSNYVYVGEEEDISLPNSLNKGAYEGSNLRRVRAKVIAQPMVPEDYDKNYHGAGFCGDNTGPIDWLENDDTSFVKARITPDRKLRVSSTAPTNFLPSMIEVDFTPYGKSMYIGSQEDFYKYFAPPIAATPKEVKIVDTDPGDGGVSSATNNDSGQTNYLKYEDMAGGDRISWTQRSLAVQFISVCPAVDVQVEARPPWGEGFKSADVKKHAIWDYGEGTEIKFKVKFPPNKIKKMSGAKFHLPEPETAHRDNKYFGDKAPISSPVQPGGWATASIGGGEYFKIYKLNPKAKENFEDFGSTNISIYFSWQAETSVRTKNPLTNFDRWGPGAQAVDNPFEDDEWFEAEDATNNIYWDKKHIIKGDWSSHMDRGFADHWLGADEQLRGCGCVSRNVHDLIIARQPPVIEHPKDGKPKQIVFDELNENNGVGIIFVDGPGQKGGDFDQLL